MEAGLQRQGESSCARHCFLAAVLHGPLPRIHRKMNSSFVRLLLYTCSACAASANAFELPLLPIPEEQKQFQKPRQFELQTAPPQELKTAARFTSERPLYFVLPLNNIVLVLDESAGTG